MRFKAVIFDLDGVLVSTDEQHYQGWKALCDRLDIPFDRETNNRFRGVSRMACVDIRKKFRAVASRRSRNSNTPRGRTSATAACSAPSRPSR